ncbi:hypothetical protein NDU88_006498 [Pleurodeles waltl]|uniref:Uncharacterized protein n=1 Tax=Pleurodeles waltl TaxID=8319 RepID=A0AAV7QIW9_PLEWA|nr:hypothetical protein NDU88_006498 [Pleurodeles waltl]
MQWSGEGQRAWGVIRKGRHTHRGPGHPAGNAWRAVEGFVCLKRLVRFFSRPPPARGHTSRSLSDKGPSLKRDGIPSSA